MTSSVSLKEQLHPVRLEVDDLRISYATSDGHVRAVDGISFHLYPGDRMGLVGESGCGKSSVVKALLKLLPDSASVRGEVRIDDENLYAMSEAELRRIRWQKISLVTQSAMNALDPVFTVGEQIVESITAHRNMKKSVSWRRAEELFEMVGLPPERLRHYPHQFSGGMRQRAVIAMAMSLNPGLLLADEPTTALDVIMQDQILSRLSRIHEELGQSILLVTHDVSVVIETCESVMVMYAGKIVERGPTAVVFALPSHPYTMGLKNALAQISGEPRKPISIPGRPPSPLAPPNGCRFAPRCPFSTEECQNLEPPLIDLGSGHYAACHYVDKATQLRELATEQETWNAKSRE